MRKYKLKRRNQYEANEIVFNSKALSFSFVDPINIEKKEFLSAGLMLYWAEGYKKVDGSTLDFANSDHSMIRLYMKFLRELFCPNENRFRVLLYCYCDQDVNKLISFWSAVTKIPKSQFSKPYVRTDFKSDGRKMQHGMVHIRYNDKRLLKLILELIEGFKTKHAPVV